MPVPAPPPRSGAFSCEKACRGMTGDTYREGGPDGAADSIETSKPSQAILWSAPPFVHRRDEAGRVGLRDAKVIRDLDRLAFYPRPFRRE